MTKHDSIEINGFQLNVSYEYTRSTPNVMYTSDGDPGYPGDPGEIDIINIELMEGELKDLLLEVSDEDGWFEKLETMLYELND